MQGFIVHKVGAVLVGTQISLVQLRARNAWMLLYRLEGVLKYEAYSSDRAMRSTEVMYRLTFQLITCCLSHYCSIIVQNGERDFGWMSLANGF